MALRVDDAHLYPLDETNRGRSEFTFNIGTAFTNAGMDLPLQQILNLDPVVTTQPHTTYSYMVPLGSNTLLMVRTGQHYEH